jgi:predicted branched-subunit amino acid permease
VTGTGREAFVAGAAAVNAGLTLVDAVGLSTVVFAGASQLAAIGLFGEGAPLALVVATVLVINLRMVMYSASIAPELLDEPPRWRALEAYLLTDQAYALSLTRFEREPGTNRWWYYLGTATTLWAVWQVCTVVGARVPPWLPLEFAVPLTFLALLVPAIEDRAPGAAAVVGGGVATLGAGIPLNAGLMIGAVAGVLAGLVMGKTIGGSMNGAPEEPGGGHA